MEFERRSKRNSLNKKERRQSFTNDESDDDCNDLFIIINDLKRDVDDHEEAFKLLRSQGFEVNNVEQKLVSVQHQMWIENWMNILGGSVGEVWGEPEFLENSSDVKPGWHQQWYGSEKTK